MHGSTLLHGDASDADRWLDRLGRESDAANESAARKRHHDLGEIGPFGEEFERDRRLAENDIAMIEWRDIGQSLLFDQPVGFLLRIVLA